MSLRWSETNSHVRCKVVDHTRFQVTWVCILLLQQASNHRQCLHLQQLHTPQPPHLRWHPVPCWREFLCMVMCCFLLSSIPFCFALMRCGSLSWVVQSSPNLHHITPQKRLPTASVVQPNTILSATTPTRLHDDPCPSQHVWAAGVNVVYDPVGGTQFQDALKNVAWGAHYLVIGFASGGIPKVRQRHCGDSDKWQCTARASGLRCSG